MEDAWRRRDLSAGFDEAAEVYQRTRPVCPPQLFDDLIGLAGLSPGNRVVEIGCGTGQATVPLAERGMAVTAVEPGPNLAAIAWRRLAGFPGTDVATASFEDWQPRGAPFKAVVAVSSLHWVDPQLRYSKPFSLLEPGAAMVVAGCLWARPTNAERSWTEVQEDYRAVGYAGDPPPPPEQIGPRHRRPRPPPSSRRSRACATPSRCATAPKITWPSWPPSPARALGPARGADFLSRVSGRLDSLGFPELTATFVGYLTVGRRLDFRPENRNSERTGR